MSEKKESRVLLRGFASLTPERRKEVAASGGKAVKPENRTYSRDRDLAVSSGIKGGFAVPPEKRSFSRYPELAKSSGAKGGAAAKLNKEKSDATVD